MNNELPSRYLSLKDAAQRYSTSKSTLYLHIKRGNLRAIKFGGHTLLDRAFADRFFDSLPEVKLGTGRLDYTA
jgi:excisionase family DNA binding protein